MIKRYTFTVKENEKEISDLLEDLPKHVRGYVIKEAIRRLSIESQNDNSPTLFTHFIKNDEKEESNKSTENEGHNPSKRNNGSVLTREKVNEIIDGFMD